MSGSVRNGHKPWGVSVVEWLVTIPSEEGRHGHNTSDNTRNYQVWSSEKQLFALGGRLRFVREKPVVVFTAFASVLPAVLFCVFEAAWCWHHVSPAVVIVCLYAWLQCFVALVKAATGDPGAIPRNIHLTDDPHDLPEEYFNLISLPANEADQVDVRYCHTCRSWRMPRSFHCSQCDQCISIHDHHCLWLNNCVGERNYSYFYAFLFFGVVSCVFMLTLGYYHIFKYHQEHHNESMAAALRHIPMTLFNVIFVHLVLLYPLLLLVVHTLLIASGQTTREYLRHWKLEKKPQNPFTLHSIVKNFVSVLCRPRGHSYVRVREKYESGDQRFQRI